MTMMFARASSLVLPTVAVVSSTSTAFSFDESQIFDQDLHDGLDDFQSSLVSSVLTANRLVGALDKEGNVATPAAKKKKQLLGPRESVSKAIGLAKNATSGSAGIRGRGGSGAVARSLAADKDPSTCDVAFIHCLTVDRCLDCFVELDSKDIDWTSVTEDTDCKDVLSFLYEGKHCVELRNEKEDEDTFCLTFDSCVQFEDDEGETPKGDGYVDCSNITECEWPGKHDYFVGDGVCHADIGCYNTEICGWDGGDCCPDTCVSKGNYTECGDGRLGYQCVNPDSPNCDPDLTSACKNPKKDDDDDEPADPSTIDCGAEATLYRLVMYDSFGDGWDSTTIKVTPSGKSSVVYEGGLKTGSEGTDYLCLSRSPSCYHVEVNGGVWGKEVSWEIKPYTGGAPALTGGGAPQSCDFGVAGKSDCSDHECGEKADVSPSKDPDYKDFKELYECITDKCPIQVGACKNDEACVGCFVEETEDYCFGIDTFNAVTDCTLCQCTDQTESDYCSKKMSPGIVVPGTKPSGDAGYKNKPCTPGETMEGSNAVMHFNKCADLDQFSVMVTEYSQDNFGDLDLFEVCANAYTRMDDHGGHTAIGCLRILVQAMAEDDVEDDSTPVPVKAVAALAKALYDDGEQFCGCVKESSEKCPICPSFRNFKTLLYEALDACQSLDNIDCDAWNEFTKPCQRNLQSEYGTINFGSREQCEYVQNGCGSAGPFPAFRRLDCDGEIPKESWDFYNLFASSCLKDGGDNTPPSPSEPKAPPTPAPISPPDKPDPVPSPITPVNPPDKKKYIPPEDRDEGDQSSSSSKTSQDEKKGKKSHWFRNLFFLFVVGGGAYYYYTRRSDGFSFVRFRRTRNFGDEGDVYSGLTMESSTTFEPPSLPPPPSALGIQ